MILKRGFALITMLAVVIAIAMTAAAILRSFGNAAAMKSNTILDVQSQYLAEAGLQYARWQCRMNSSVCVGSATYTINGIPVQVTADTKVNNANTIYALTAAVTYAEL